MPPKVKDSHLMVNEDLELVSDYLLSDRLSHCFQTTGVIDLKSNILLIDSCSTVNLVTNKDLLHNIHEVQKPL